MNRQKLSLELAQADTPAVFKDVTQFAIHQLDYRVYFELRLAPGLLDRAPD
jgi:hypothetical protein